MKLWHQSFAQLDKLPRYVAAIREHLDKVAAPGTTIDIHGMRPGSHTTMQPGKDIGYSYVQHMHSLQFLDSVRQAEKEGYNAFLLSTIPDPYLQIAQSIVDIPVVTVKMAEMLVSLRRTSGLMVNRQNYFYAKPADGRFDELKDFYQLK